MTDKRFVIDKSDSWWDLLDTKKDTHIDGSLHFQCVMEQVCDLLNELHMENMGLKSSNMEYEDALGRLEEENEDRKYLLRVYTDFMVSKGYELSDVIEYSKEMEELTEERFTINMEDECIDDAYHKIFIDFNDKIDFYELCNFLNELHEENMRLKQDKQHLHQAMSRQEVKHKKFKDKVFDLIDKSLEKDKHDYEMTYKDYLNGRIEVLEDLKKELLND